MVAKSQGRTMKDITESDKTWQKLRKSLIGTWKSTPVENVKKLRSYLGNIKTTTNEKLIIILNYLTGTGFRTGRIKHPEITKLRKEVKEEIQRRRESGEWKKKS